MPIAIKINPADNVVVALHPIAKGTAVPVDNTTVTAVEDIPQGHKMAIAAIKAGENVIKYGFPIGHATADAVPGTWMHTHNIKTNLSGEIEYSYHPDVHPLTPVAPETFMGYRRKDGRAAIRNEIWIIPTVGCVNDCAKALVRDNQDLVTGNIDGLYTFTHPFGCSQTGHDHAQTRKLLAALTRHPNAGAVLVLSLGCENLTHDQFLAELGDYDHDRVKFLTCQDVEDELVAGGLYQRGRGVEFVQEEDAFLRVLRMGQEFRHAPGGDALIADAGQSAQVHRVQQHGAQVVELAALAAGHVGHQPALAYTGRPPEEHGLPDAHQMMQCLTDVAGSHAGVLLNKLNFIFN